MGILNVTPDSFSDGGAYLDPDAAVAHAVEMASEGADLIDVGGESTRPGARPIPVEEEAARVVPIVTRLCRRLHVPISVDTSKAEVARRAIDAGADIVNDVTALRGDPAMADVIARGGAGVILMHMQGTPQRMQRHPRYADVVSDVCAFLREATRRAQAAGISQSRMLVDPGLGFGKSVRHNLELMRGLRSIVALGYPVVLGPSRKSFIGAVLDLDLPQRLAGTLACVAVAQQAGVHVVRVHDVRPSVQLLEMMRAIQEAHATRREH